MSVVFLFLLLLACFCLFYFEAARLTSVQEHPTPHPPALADRGDPQHLRGEAPGADEEIQGEPFVGRAGQLLTKIIEAMGLQRSDVYIGNIMNWRPKTNTSIGNRPPTQEEMNLCLPYLRAQLEVVKPEVIVALGNTAANGLLGHDPKRRLSSIRGKWFEFEKTPLIITYHPSYILRSGSIYNKRIIWEDMLLVLEKIGLKITDRQRQFFTSES